MAGSVRIKVNRDGVRALLASADVSSDLASRGKRIAEAAGDGFDVSVTRNRDRAVVFVRTASVEAMKAEAEDRALTFAIDAGR
jgi:hypothetical protein